MDIFKLLCAMLGIAGVMYLGFAFIPLELNVLLWTEGMRAAYVAFLLCAYTLLISSS